MSSPAPPPDPLSDPSPRPHNTKAVVWVVIGVVVVLLVVMLASYRYGKANGTAQAKAEQLVAAAQQAGLPTPLSAENVARVLGDDGGTVCSAAGDRAALSRLNLQLGVGGAFYVRAILQNPDLWRGLHLIVQVYCPQDLPTVEEYLGSLNLK